MYTSWLLINFVLLWKHYNQWCSLYNKKIYINHDKINQDLEENWIVVSEAIQTILRREGYENPYEVMKELTRKNSAWKNWDFSEVF